MVLGSHQKQGVLKPLITLTPVLHMRAQEKKKKMVLPPQGIEKAQMTETPTNPQLLMNYIIWNVRGGNNVEFRMHYSTMVQLHKHVMLVLAVLLETRMDDHKKLTEELQFDLHIQFPVIGLSRGIFIKWKKDIIQIDEVSTTHQGIHVMVKVADSKDG